MNSLKLKNTLISEISQIDDTAFLSALKIIVDSRKTSLENNFKENNYELTLSEEDIVANDFYSQSEILSEVEKWKLS
ncbi:hypothetical protein [Flavobacterium sp. 1355]|uniref:hypothetical protein n=1 Tax=Flavobacterium sp. 1355 TaxID=2806571 RepID=UPI001AEAE029|nr:hypothetical protein [Flavobacterium sp. 1355]MBP1222737.1 hypothetical protein [Flavobacterium sp. 1355]